MPIHIIPINVRTILAFGTGDIHVSEAQTRDADGNEIPIVVFIQKEPLEIGTGRPHLAGTECDDCAVGMHFTKAESIDVVIKTLTRFKDENFSNAQEELSQPGTRSATLKAQ